MLSSSSALKLFLILIGRFCGTMNSLRGADARGIGLGAVTAFFGFCQPSLHVTENAARSREFTSSKIALMFFPGVPPLVFFSLLGQSL